MTIKSKTAVSLFLVTIALVGFFPTSWAKASTNEIEPLWGPYITGTTESNTVINWKTAEPTWGVVQYITQEQYALHGGYQNFAIGPVLRQLHQIRLTDLKSAEQYRYRIWVVGSHVSPDNFPTQNTDDIEVWLQEHGSSTQDFSFRTMGDQSFTFVVYGDSQEQYPFFTQMERHKLVADTITQESGLSFIVHLGDFTYDADDLDGWDIFFEAGREMLANNTIYPAMGNHEDYSPVYHEIFGMPEYYSFQSGQARFIVLGTYSRADFEAQKQWLQDEFSSASKWDFVFYHHPAYSSDARNFGGWELSRTHWEEIFVNAGVSAVFSGHVHAYERYLVKGLNYFVVGTGGGLLSDLSQDMPAGLQNRLAKTLGYARVSVDPEQATVEFIKVALVSDDNRDVLEIYPFGTIYETVTFEPVEAKQPLWRPEADFRVSPVSLSIDVDRGSSSHFSLRITSSDDAYIYVDTEDLPFEVMPAAFPILGSEQAQKFDLELFGNETIPNGTYEGKLTVLCDVGDNVALGVKVKTAVSQTGADQGLKGGSFQDNVYLIIAVILILATNIGGYLVYHRYKARITEMKGI